jgi:transposase
MIKDLQRKGLSVSEIARLSGHDRKTVRRVIGTPLLATPAVRRRKPRKLDPYVPYLERRMAEGVFNVPKLLREIRNQGYTGGTTQLRLFVQPHRPARASGATLRFETEPGEQAQVDWAHFGFLEHEGRRCRLYAFVMTLGWSRTLYLEFTTSTAETWFLRGHLHAFHYFGGVPREVLHDNLKTAVLERQPGGDIRWQPRYLDFAHYYGFTPRACQPYRAQTKGKVESGIRYVRSSFWPGLHFSDLADLNRQALAWLDTIANQRQHGTTGEVPFVRLPLEQLPPILGLPDYDTSWLTTRKSSRDCLLSYGGNYYSVPATQANQVLLVRELESGELVICAADGTEVARHALVNGSGQRTIIPAHYESLSVRHRHAAAARWSR